MRNYGGGTRMKQKKQRKIAGIIAIIIAIAMILSIAAPFMASVNAMPISTEEGDTDPKAKKEIGQDHFSLDMKVGYNGDYIVGNTTPISGVLTNTGEEFNGELQVKVYSDYYGDEEMEGPYSIYYQPVSLAKGAAKKIDLEINPEMITDYFEVTLVNEKGKTVFLENVAGNAMSPDTVMIGVLSDNPSDLSYFSGLKWIEVGDDEQRLQKTIYLDASTFPKKTYTLKNFQAIVIEDFDTTTLQETQINSLKEWIQGGGTLILGTGPNSQKVLGGLQELESFQIGGTTQIHSFPNLSQLLQDQNSLQGDMMLSSITAKGMEERFSEQGHSITSRMSLGKGDILLHHFALSLSPVADNPNFIMALQNMYSSELCLDVQEDEYGVYRFQNLQRIAEDFPVLKSNMIYPILLSILIYVILIGPVLYFLLKKKDKREWGWAIIPCLSLFFMGVIFIMSRNSQYNSGLFNFVSVTELSDNTSIGTTAGCGVIKSPQQGKITFSMDQPLQTLFFDDDRHYYSRGTKDAYARKVLVGDTTEVTYLNNQSWATNSFMTEVETDLGGVIESNILLKGNRFVGEIQNHTDLDFYDVVLNLGGHYEKFDQLLSGESLKIDYVMKEEDGDKKDYWEILDELYGDLYNRSDVNRLIQEGKIEKDQVYTYFQERKILEEYLESDDMESNVMVPIDFYGFSDHAILLGDKYLNGEKALERGMGLYYKKLALNLENMNEFDIPFGFIYPAEYQSNDYVDHYRRDGMIYAEQKQEVVCVYELSQNIGVDLFQVHIPDDKSYFYAPTQIKNWKENTWEDLKNTEYKQTQDYISDKGTIDVKLSIKEDTDVFVPELRLKGGSNYVGN